MARASACRVGTPADTLWTNAVVAPTLPRPAAAQYIVPMDANTGGFRAEYLSELDVARIQLLALAAAVPEELYSWRPTDGTRSFSAVLVHIAAGNLMLLWMTGVRTPAGENLYASIDGDDLGRVGAMIRINVSLERTLTDKQGVMQLLTRSFDAAREAFSAVEDLDRSGTFLGQQGTVRRVYLRMLAHSHEHMGQAIAYVRSCGLEAPWPDPLKDLDQFLADARSRQSASAG